MSASAPKTNRKRPVKARKLTLKTKIVEVRAPSRRPAPKMRVPRPLASDGWALALTNPFRASPRRFPDGVGTPTALAKLQSERVLAAAPAAWMVSMDTSLPPLCDWMSTWYFDNASPFGLNVGQVSDCQTMIGGTLSYQNLTTGTVIAGLSGNSWECRQTGGLTPPADGDVGLFDFDGNRLWGCPGGCNPYQPDWRSRAGVLYASPSRTNGPQWQLTQMSSKARTTAAGIRVSVSGLPSGMFMAPGNLYLLQLPRDSYTELFPSAAVQSQFTGGFTNVAPWYAPPGSALPTQDTALPPPLTSPTTAADFTESKAIALVRAGRGRCLTLDTVLREGGATLAWRPTGPEAFIMQDPTSLANGRGSGRWSFNVPGLTSATVQPSLAGAGCPAVTGTWAPFMPSIAACGLSMGDAMDAEPAYAPPDMLFAVYFGVAGVTIRLDFVAHREYVPEVGSAGLVATAVVPPSMGARERLLADSAAISSMTSGDVGPSAGGSVVDHLVSYAGSAAGAVGSFVGDTLGGLSARDRISLLMAAARGAGFGGAGAGAGAGGGGLMRLR